MVAPKALSEQDVVEARAALSAGKPFMVWFTAAAVGVQAGGSAKVVAVDDAAEGDFIQVKPAGSRDTMFCSPSELTRTRPARKRAEPPARVVEPPAVRVSPPRAQPPQPSTSLPPPSRPAPEPLPQIEPEPKVNRPRSVPARPAEVTLTLSANPDGEWTVDVMIGKKRVVRPTPVQPGDVAKAARSLPGTVTEAIESSLQAARLRQIDRVERLRAELKSAEQALQELSG